MFIDDTHVFAEYDEAEQWSHCGDFVDFGT